MILLCAFVNWHGHCSYRGKRAALKRPHNEREMEMIIELKAAVAVLAGMAAAAVVTLALLISIYGL
jgi:hypothetical protein